MEYMARRKSLWNLLPGLVLVMLLAAIAAFIVPRSRINYVGVDTARLKTVYTIAGIPVNETYKDRKLTLVLEKYLGQLPNETEWIYVNESGDGWIGIKASGWGERIRSTSDSFADFIESKQLKSKGMFYYEMTDAAKCFVLRNYIESIRLSKPREELYGVYAWDVQLAVGYLDHPAGPDDLPPLEEVRNPELWKSKWEPRIDKLIQEQAEHNSASSTP